MLKVAAHASAEEIKDSYRALALEYHPDKNTLPQAALAFAQLQEAWEVLRDAAKRRDYDQRLLRDKDAALQQRVVVESTHVSGAIEEDDLDEDEHTGLPAYQCRCGGVIVIDEATQRSTRVTVLSCPSCSLRYRYLKPQ